MKKNNLNLTKSKERVQKHGEVFTPDWIVNDMLDMLPEEVWNVGKTFLEPSCGEGAFLMEVYKRKLEKIKCESVEEFEYQAAIATSSIYGIELLEDNLEKCIINLMTVFINLYNKNYSESQDEDVIKTIHFLLKKNILQGNFLTRKILNGENIIISEWIPIENYQFQRIDTNLDEIINANNKSKVIQSDNMTVQKKFKPINWKYIRYEF